YYVRFTAPLRPVSRCLPYNQGKADSAKSCCDAIARGSNSPEWMQLSSKEPVFPTLLINLDWTFLPYDTSSPDPRQSSRYPLRPSRLRTPPHLAYARLRR